jgi:S1-C subfamily serine protease
MNLILEVVEPGRAPRRVNVTKSLAIIGRSSQCDVRIDAESVSARHARIKRYQDHVVVEDLGSTNGLLVNGERITSPAYLSDGDEIQVGTNGPILVVIAGTGVSSANVRSAARTSGRRPAKGSQAGRGILIASTLCGMLLFLAAGAATLWWLAGMGRDRLEISSITDPRLSQAVGMVICNVEFKDGRLIEELQQTGSAFVVTSDGYLVTNKHVVEGFDGGVDKCVHMLFEREKDAIPTEKHDKVKSIIAGLFSRPRIWVALNGRYIDAEVKMISDTYDLAILKIDRKELPCFALSTNEVGRLTEVTAMGFPAAAARPFPGYDTFDKLVREETGKGISRFFKPSDLEFTQTQGKVSKLTEEASANSARKITWIQHTASISGGNSGGPLCLNDGVVVGINTYASKEDANIKLSFDINQVREELEAVTGQLSWR